MNVKPERLKYNDRSHSYWLDGKRAKGVTTIAKTLEDGYALSKWGQRMVAVGMASAPHLIDAVAAHFDDRQKLDELVEDALREAKSHHAATRGTAMHRATERFDRGEAMIHTELLAATVSAWRDALDREGYEVIPEYVERVVVFPEHMICGTFDRIVRRKSDGLLRILDLKSGERALKYPDSICIQLGLYANAPWIAGTWDGESGETTEFEPLPDLDRELGLVLHMPDPSLPAVIAEVDIAGGWEIAQRAIFPTLAWRKRTDKIRILEVERPSVAVPEAGAVDDPFVGLDRDLHHAGTVRPPLSTPAVPSPSKPPASANSQPRVEWIAQRVDAVKACGPKERDRLIRAWPHGPRPPKAMRTEETRDYTDAEVALIEAALTPIERDYGLPLSGDPVTVAAGIAERHETRKYDAEIITAAPYCPTCDHGGHTCPGCGTDVPHGTIACAACYAIDEGPQASDADIDAILVAFETLDTKVDKSGWCPHLQSRAWLGEMATAGTPLGLTKVRSARRLAIAKAIHALANYDDAVARAALEVVLGISLFDGDTTGRMLAALTIHEAVQLAQVARALETGAMVERISVDGAVSLVAA